MFKNNFKKCLITLLFSGVYCFSFSQTTEQKLCDKVIVGYWHTWQNANAPFIKLREVPCYYNVVNLSFLEPASPSDPTMHLTVEENLETTDEIIADIKLLKARGIRVMASIGGANGAVALLNSTDKNKFTTSIQTVIEKFGLQGIDIDIEHGMTLGAEDSDVTNPKSPRLVNLIDAIRTIKTKNGADFWITMAPETPNVQGGAASFSGIFGVYLPIIHSLRDILTYVHVQYYNTGGTPGSDGNNYNQGTADFIVAMSDMLLSGFKLGNSSGTLFPALRQDQVAFGIPAINGAASGGYMPMTEVVKALDYLTKGISFGGKYKLATTHFPNLRGIMTWSINWDKSASYQFGKTFSNYFCGSTDLCANVSVNEKAPKETFHLYPNPATDKITLTASAVITSVEIYTINGAHLKTISTPETSIDIKELKAGVYYLKSYVADKVYVNKLVKF